MPTPAPTPGVGDREAAIDAAQEEIITLRFRDKTYSLAVGNVPFGEQEIFLKSTGFTYETLFDGTMGMIKVIGIWFLARRLAGEKRLSWAKAKQQWKDLGLRLDELELELEEPDEESQDPQS